MHFIREMDYPFNINKSVRELLLSNFDRRIIETTRGRDFYHSNDAIKSSLLRKLYPHFPRVQIHLFGSRVIGTGTNTSDLDIYIDVDQSYYTRGYEKSIMPTVYAIKKILTDCNDDDDDEWCDLWVKNAEIPLIKVFNRKFKVQCDISFSDGEGHRNTRLIKFLCDVQPVFRKMIITLGQWLDYSGLSKHFNNHMLRLLILHYLQSMDLLPSIRALQQDIADPLQIGPWNVDFDRTQAYVTKTDDLDTLIIGFFKHYNSFSAFDGIICTYLGKLMPKDYLYEYNSYEYSNLNVRGPFNLIQNPSKKISNKVLDQFIDMAQESYRFLLNK